MDFRLKVWHNILISYTLLLAQYVYNNYNCTYHLSYWPQDGLSFHCDMTCPNPCVSTRLWPGQHYQPCSSHLHWGTALSSLYLGSHNDIIIILGAQCPNMCAEDGLYFIENLIYHMYFITSNITIVKSFKWKHAHSNREYYDMYLHKTKDVMVKRNRCSSVDTNPHSHVCTQP